MQNILVFLACGLFIKFRIIAECMYVYRVYPHPYESGALKCYAEHARNAVRKLGYKALLLHRDRNISLVTDRELETNARAAAMNFVFLGNSKNRPHHRREIHLRGETVDQEYRAQMDAMNYQFQRREEFYRSRGFGPDESFRLARQEIGCEKPGF